MIAMALLLTNCAPRPEELQKTQVAEERARQWLTLMDARDYGGSWDAATALFQRSIAKDEWEARARRTQLDRVGYADRTLIAAKYTATYPMASVPGEYVIVQYRTQFGGRPGIETVYMRLASDGQWKADGYVVRGDAQDAVGAQSSPRLPPAPAGLVVGSGNFYGPLVADLDEAVAFYRDGLGFDVQGEPTNADASPQLGAMLGMRAHVRLRRQIGRTPLMPGNLEIVEIPAASGRQAERRIDAPGTVMLIVIVRDIDATLARLKRLGAPVVTPGGAPRWLDGGVRLRAVVVKDPAGHFVEILQTLRPPAARSNANVLAVRVRHTVHDLARSLALYRDALEIQSDIAAIPAWQSNDSVLDALGLEGTRQYRFATLTVPTSGLTMELIEFDGARPPAAPARIADLGSVRLELRVANVDAAVAAVTQAGGELVWTGERPLDLPVGGDTLEVSIVRDPDDLFLVLAQ